MYNDFFDLFKYLLNWLTNPGCTNLLLIALGFGVGYRCYKWFNF